MATKAELEAKIERERLELVALRNKAAALPDGPERDAIQAQRDALRAQQKTTTRELEVATNQSPATGQFEGVDANSGEYRYKNPETGTSFLSPVAPTAAQQQQSGVTAPTPAATPLPTEARPETAPAAVQTPATAPALVDTVSPADVPPSQSPYESQRTQQNQQIQAASPQEVPVAQSLAPGEEIVPTDAPAPQTVETFRPGESTITNVTEVPAPVPDTFEAGGGGGNQGTITRVTYEPQDVPPTVDPAAGKAESAANPQQSTVNIGTAENNALASAGAALKQKAQDEGAVQAQFQSPANGDWRVRLRLAPGAKYLYMDDNNTLLKPLKASGGVVFPYMPTIQTSYNADYESTELTHSNYRGQFYKSSYVGDVQITGTFTAQDTAEANYLLAVIHFFRSVTKMFYGAKDPLRGAPPPLVYLIGLGQYQFNNQPCVVKTFNYSMPNDCDYIRTKPNNYNTNLGGRSPKPQASNDPVSSVVNRLKNALLPQGAVPNVPAQSLLDMQSVTNIADSTYVPTKCEIQLTLMPIQTRSQQSQQFSMEAFANGNLLKGGFW